MACVNKILIYSISHGVFNEPSNAMDVSDIFEIKIYEEV